jgi:hypothetical protein
VNYKKSLQVTVEPVTLTDTVMLHSWPPVISRILFKEKNKTLKGSNVITVKPVKTQTQANVLPVDNLKSIKNIIN